MGYQTRRLTGLAREMKSSLAAIFEKLLLHVGLAYGVLLLLAAAAPRYAVCMFLRSIDSLHLCQHTVQPRPVGCSSSAAFKAVLDWYAVAHVVGWFVKALIFPCRRTLWMTSILFEFVELLATFLMPYLRECVWDRFIFDPLCNAIGIEIGLLVTRKLSFNRILRFRGKLRWCVSLITVTTDLSFFILRESFQLRMFSPLHITRIIFLIALGFSAAEQLINKQYNRHVAAYITLLVLETVQLVWI